MRLLVLILVLITAVEGYCGEEKWKEHKTRHFIILYKEASLELIEQTGKEAEDLFGDISHNMRLIFYPQWRGNTRLKIYVYDDKEDYRLSNIKMEHTRWSAGMADFLGKAIKTYPQQRKFFLNNLLPHELGHIFLRESVGMRADIPTWFSEGIAVLQEESGQRLVNHGVKKVVEEKGYISFGELDGKARGVIKWYYPASASATGYLLSRMPGNKLKMFLRYLREGESFENAVGKATNRKIKDINDLNEKWMNYIKENEFPAPKVTYTVKGTEEGAEL